jgi:Protein of unknown function (DUF3467)
MKKSTRNTGISVLTTPSSEEVAKMTKQVEGMGTLYSNHARIAAGAFDVRIFFGEQNITPTGQTTFTEKLCVVIAPEFAKMFLSLLTNQVNSFEVIFGGLRPPVKAGPELQAALEKELRRQPKQ